MTALSAELYSNNRGYWLTPQGSTIPFVVLVVIETIIIVYWNLVGNILYLPFVVLAAWFVFLSVTSLLTWLPFVVLGHAFLFMQKTEGVSISEAGFAAYYYGILFLWFVERLFVRREKLSTVAGDLALFVFLALAVMSIVQALLQESIIFLWLRELLVFAGYLLYFPLREGLRTRRGKILIYGAFVLLATAVAVKNLFQYRTGVLIATYVWEVLGARQTANEPLFMTMMLAGVAVWISTDNKWKQIGSLAMMSLFSVSLILTFSRGYWLGTIIGMMVFLLLGTARERMRLFTLGIIVSGAATVILLLLFQDIAKALFFWVAQRFFSATSAIADKSVANRFVEAQIVWELIKSNPIVGYGLGVKYSYYHLLRESTQHTEYVHNAYLYLLFKLGVVGTVVFLWTYLSKIALGVQIFFRQSFGTSRPFVLTSVAVLIAMLQVSLTSPQFYARDSVLIITLCWATIAANCAQSPVNTLRDGEAARRAEG